MVRAFRSEWLKILRRGMLLGSAGAMTALSILGVVLVTLRAQSGRGELSVARLSQPDGFASLMSRTGAMLGVIVLGTVAIAVAQEYTHGTLRSLLVREPRRLRLLAGKLAANLLFVAAGVTVAFAAALVTGLILGPSQGIDTSSWLGSGLGHTLSTGGTLVLGALGYGLFGCLLAVVLRSPAPAVIAGIAWALPVEGLLSSAWSSLGTWLPFRQLDAIIAQGTSTIGYGHALVMGSAYAALACVVAAVLFRQRDVLA
jgi:ABC-type transport system involved in multi-copper enzyme maturation permease subunit